MVPNWSPKTPNWKDDEYKLLTTDDINEPSDITLEEFLEKSEHFPIPFPVDTGRCITLKQHASKEILERNINSAYPVIHENALHLCAKFILLKSKHGSDVEKSLYSKISLKNFIDRLLTKRAVKFMGRFDSYKLINGEKGANHWDTIGTPKEKPPLVLKDCISYDEVKLSVFLSVSSYSYFVNVGDRKNNAVYATDRKNIADEGIIIGLIGTRLKKQNVMEYQELFTDKNQNTKENGYGVDSPNIHNLFAEFYEEKCRTYEETVEFKNGLGKDDSKRFTDVKKPEGIFDNHLYYKRISITFDTLLMEADKWAKEKETTAFIHVVGLGLGVWKVSPHQEQVFMDIFGDRIKKLGEHLFNISDICFSYIQQPDCGGYKHGEKMPIKNHPLAGIKIHINKRNPHEKLKNNDAGKLLVISYAWDGNALPGNEYWDGKLGSSGDSASASSTQITELHNPHINPKVCADNLQVVTKDGIISFKEYREVVKCNRRKRKHSE